MQERFKREIYRGGGSPPIPTVETFEEDLAFFQDMLINERLHPEYYAFYHSVPPVTAGLLFLNSAIARLIHASGAVDHARVQPYDDAITKWLQACYVSHKTEAEKYTDATGAVKNVNAIVQFLNNNGPQDNDQDEPVTKHLSSTSYSLFTPQLLSAIGFFKYCVGKNKLDAVFKNTWDQLTGSVLDADKYSKMIDAKFTEKDIGGQKVINNLHTRYFQQWCSFLLKKKR